MRYIATYIFRGSLSFAIDLDRLFSAAVRDAIAESQMYRRARGVRRRKTLFRRARGVGVAIERTLANFSEEKTCAGLGKMDESVAAAERVRRREVSPAHHDG